MDTGQYHHINLCSLSTAGDSPSFADTLPVSVTLISEGFVFVIARSSMKPNCSHNYRSDCNKCRAWLELTKIYEESGST